MATNADEGADNTDQEAEDILRSSKYPKDEVETSEEEDETSDGEETEEDTEADSEDDTQSDDEAEGDKDSEEESKEDSEDEDLFVKKFPNIKGDTLPEYTQTLEAAYENSTSEAMKWKKRAEEAEAKLGSDGKDSKDDTQAVDTDDPLRIWAQQNLDNEVAKAYDDFVKSYPQATESENWNKFIDEVAILSETIKNSQKRMAPPSELYAKAAVILGWEPTQTEPTKGERLKSALKDGAAIPKTTTSSKKKPKSKVTDAQVAVYRKMNPTTDKSDSDIRKELEDYA